MNPPARKGIENALVAELRRLAPGAKPNMRAIRLAVAAETGGCGVAELADAVRALRFAGKIAFDRIELSESMKLAAAPVAAADGPEPGTGPAHRSTPGSGPDECASATSAAELYRLLMEKGARLGLSQSRVSHQAFGNATVMSILKLKPVAVSGRTLARALAWLARPDDEGGCERSTSRPAARPAPAHEPEVAREVREEVAEAAERRRRARSSGSVRLPVELKRFAVPDMDLSEALGTMLTATPQALLRAVQRKHPKLWRRAILLGRSRGESPMLTVYAALEAGLQQIEAEQPSRAEAA